jgi:hypothetical protein
MVIKKVPAPLGAEAKPRESRGIIDVCDIEALCDAIEELVQKRKRSPRDRATDHRGSASDETRRAEAARRRNRLPGSMTSASMAGSCGNRSLSKDMSE